LGWSLFAVVAAILLIVVVSALRRVHGNERNRGPGTEAAPGAEPSRDIDRSRSR
jgi:hypothetical protein